MTDQPDTPAPRALATALARDMAESDAFRTALADLIAFRTDATRPDSALTLAAYLDHVEAGLRATGFETERVAADGHPFLIARRIEDAARPTVLGYSHGDTVPGMEGRWQQGRDPWTLTEEPETGRLYGRGIADNKGQFLVNLTALQAVMAARGGTLGFNALWIIEMGEEIGSPGLRSLCAEHKDDFAADLLLASDGPRIEAAQPTIFLGARGGHTFKLHLKRRDGGRHSGNFGGVLRNPGLEMAHALATIADARGAIQVPGWTPEGGVPDPVRRALAGLIPAGGEVDDGWGEPELSPAERVHGWNSAEILAFTCGTPDQPVNAIPPEATAWVQLRHVTGLDEDRLAAHLRAHLDAQGFGDIEVTEDGPAFAASATPPDHPAAAFAAGSLARTQGVAPVVLPSLGGSLPNDIFTDLLGLPTVWVPHSYPGCSQHAPDEHLPKALLPEAASLMAGLYWDLGEVDRAELRRQD
ncbi:Acetylornithine deacetylase/Succinyl-diaminopimelate desuccinylase [Roseibacterium elongatum DSM 19469]|uniref:Acetylornithine deacetylase/Succinyl-diaminopimelate desuccinylase n=1 Tax=Roseicyclus elongatus DSM 19469 TaxID=1294273 RepID=W8RV98_9RHOB|nr:M20/M25/M40 family metallo-hydrolase [Roseibacterium elongatum]AHM05203.1 Acetylornithine deacetylase/Succinyl-diaminopimelate desuccinylase [Roseibacterium elongatum DSM 19469]